MDKEISKSVKKKNILKSHRMMEFQYEPRIGRLLLGEENTYGRSFQIRERNMHISPFT
jgi:hypothetical protein